MYGIVENGEVVAKFAAPLTVRSNKPFYASDALSLKRTVSTRAAQRWEISTGLVPLSDGAQRLFVLMVTQGVSKNVMVKVPQNYGVIKARTLSSTAPVTTGSAAASNSSVAVINHNGFIPRGTFVKFANHGKLYMTTSDLNGNGTMNIYPELRVTVPTATAFSHGDDVHVNFLFDTDTVSGMRYSDGILMDPDTVNLVEAI
jgi:hypothetical protein